MSEGKKLIDFLVVDTSAFLQNSPLQDFAKNIVTCPEVVNEVKNKRQLRRLVVLPYDLIVKDVFDENIRIVTEFAKKTGDYLSLSATDLKIIALTYQLHKEKEGLSGVRHEPIKTETITTNSKECLAADVKLAGFFSPDLLSNELDHDIEEECNDKFDDTLSEAFDALDCQLTKNNNNDVLHPATECSIIDDNSEKVQGSNSGWITLSNIQIAKRQVQSELIEEKSVSVACLTTDFAIQNVLKQMNLNVSALDGRIIKHIRTYILRCYTCFKTTSIMSKKFCPKCGNNTLKRVAVSLDQDGKMQIHINTKRPLSARGKVFSLPTFKGGKHSNNPIIVADQPVPKNRVTKLAAGKNNPLDNDYIAGYSPFMTRDINSKSAQLGIRSGRNIKQWVGKNQNQAKRKQK